MVENKKVSGKFIGGICIGMGIASILIAIFVAVSTKNLAVGIGSIGGGLFCLGIGIYLVSVAGKNTNG